MKNFPYKESDYNTFFAISKRIQNIDLIILLLTLIKHVSAY